MADRERTWKRWWAGPVVGLEREWWERMLANGVRCFEDTACWITFFDGWKVVDDHLYVRQPDEPQHSVDARQEAFKRRGMEALAEGTDLWERDLKPATEAHLATMRKSRPRSDRRVEPLIDHVELCMDEGAHTMGYLHWVLAFSLPMDWHARFTEITGLPDVEASACVSGLDHATSRMVRRICKLAKLRQQDAPEFDTAFASFLRTYGRRTGRGYGSDTTFRSPTWGLDPQMALDVIDAYARQDVDELLARDRKARRARSRAVARIRKQVEDTAAFDELINAAVRSVIALEDHNALMEQETEGTVREAIDRLGRALVRDGRLGKPDEVFYLSLDELRSGGDFGPIVEERRRLVRERAANPPPEHFGPAPVGPPMSVEAETPEATEPLPPNVLRGVAASPGQVTGRAVVVTSPSHAPPDVEPGDILVASDAGPAWTPVFPVVAALVLDRGAIWQHAALVAREFGIPAVLATKTGTSAIAHGATIAVDGTAGLVEIV